MREYLWRVSGLLMGLVTVSAAVEHVGTFLTILAPIWVLLPTALWFVGAATTYVGKPGRMPKFEHPGRLFAVAACYAVAIFIIDYRATYGGTGVTIHDGEYAVIYKDRVIRAITADEYRAFPNLQLRSMSAWLVALGILGWWHLLDRAPAVSRRA